MITNATPTRSIATSIERVGSGETVALEVPRGEREEFQKCGLGSCTYGIPGSVRFWGDSFAFFDSERYAEIEIFPSNRELEVRDYPGETLRLVGRLRVRIREDFEGTETKVVPTVIPASECRQWDLDQESGALVSGLPRLFSPARSASGARIVIRGARREFTRGDVNLDTRIDLTDAVVILRFLFLGVGGPLPCEDTPITFLDGISKYEKAVEVADGHGERVTEPGELMGALERALKAVTVERRQALVNVMCS